MCSARAGAPCTRSGAHQRIRGAEQRNLGDDLEAGITAAKMKTWRGRAASMAARCPKTLRCVGSCCETPGGSSTQSGPIENSKRWLLHPHRRHAARAFDDAPPDVAVSAHGSSLEPLFLTELDALLASRQSEDHNSLKIRRFPDELMRPGVCNACVAIPFGWATMRQLTFSATLDGSSQEVISSRLFSFGMTTL